MGTVAGLAGALALPASRFHIPRLLSRFIIALCFQISMLYTSIQTMMAESLVHIFRE